MKKFIHQALIENCPAYKQDLEQQQVGKLDYDNKFRWQSLFVNSKNPEFALAFTKASPTCTDPELDSLYKFMADAEEKEFSPTCCRTFGCDESQIAVCHKKVLKNAKGEPSNSPAYFIREENLQNYAAQEAFDAMKDEILEKIASGDMTAHMEDGFIKAAADLKSRNPLAFAKLKEDLEGLKVKMTAFNEEVGKLAKTVSKKNAETRQTEVPEHLKPYSEGTDHSTSYVDEQGHIIALVQTKDDAIPVQASNFAARIKEVREFDDGVETVQQFVIDGLLHGETKLPEITLPAEYFRSMNWAEKHWGNVLITSAPKARDIVRETILRVSANAPKIKVHYTLGWKLIEDKWCYLYSGGAVGGENVAVAEINELQGYYFKEYPYSIEECAATVQTFLDIAKTALYLPPLKWSLPGSK